MGVTASAPLIQAANIRKEFPSGKDSKVVVLKGIDLAIPAGQFLVMVGPSGAGKSTLLHILGGVDRPTAGEVRFNGESIFAYEEERLAEFRNRTLGFIFQFHHLLPEFTALENVAMPALLRGEPLRACRARAAMLLDEVGLSHRLEHRPTELSGGEQQRVAVARALMNSPKLVLADEPSGNLDEVTGEKLHDLLEQLSSQHGVTFVVATHNPDLAQRAKCRIHLVDGKIVE